MITICLHLFLIKRNNNTKIVLIVAVAGYPDSRQVRAILFLHEILLKISIVLFRMYLNYYALKTYGAEIQTCTNIPNKKPLLMLPS